MKPLKLFSALIFLMPLFFFLSGMPDCLSASGMTTIRTLKKIEINNSDILLGDIAEITGEDRALIKKLRPIVIGKAPLPGKSRYINKDYLIIRLKQKKIDLSHIRLHVPQKIEVIRGFVEIPGEDIEKLVLNYIYKRSPWERNKIKVKSIQPGKQVVLPKGKIGYRIKAPKNMALLGKIPLSIIFDVNGSFKKKLWITADIEVTTEIIVTKRRIKRYKEITEDDIQSKKMNLAVLPSNIITNPELVLGKRAKRTINANVALRTDLIELPPLVRRGDIVSIIAESDGLRVTAMGVVKERGCKGAMVRVVNLGSNKKIYARVIDSNTVKVDF